MTTADLIQGALVTLVALSFLLIILLGIYQVFFPKSWKDDLDSSSEDEES